MCGLHTVSHESLNNFQFLTVHKNQPQREWDPMYVKMHISVSYFRLNIRNWGENRSEVWVYILINSLSYSLIQQWHLQAPTTESLVGKGKGMGNGMGPLILEFSPHSPSTSFFGFRYAYSKMLLSIVIRAKIDFIWSHWSLQQWINGHQGSIWSCKCEWFH